MEQHQEMINMMAMGLQQLGMPKKEFLHFDGDPIKYPRFIKNFEVNVERRIQDETVRLSYLIQYCTGVAQDAVANCIILPPNQGYREAHAILKKNSGQKHIIVRDFIDKVICGPQIKASEPKKLVTLARDMKNCVLNSIQMGDIDSIDTLKKVVKRLPAYLQAKWAEISSKLIKDEKEPRFSHRANFVEDKASVANTTFGRLVESKPDSAARDNKPKATGASSSPPAKVTSLATTNSSSAVAPSSTTPSYIHPHHVMIQVTFRSGTTQGTDPVSPLGLEVRDTVLPSHLIDHV